MHEAILILSCLISVSLALSSYGTNNANARSGVTEWQLSTPSQLIMCEKTTLKWTAPKGAKKNFYHRSGDSVVVKRDGYYNRTDARFEWAWAGAVRSTDGTYSIEVQSNPKLEDDCKTARKVTTSAASTTASTYAPSKTNDPSKNPKNWKIDVPSAIDVCFGEGAGVLLTTHNLPLGVPMSATVFDSSGKTVVDKPLYSLSKQQINLNYVLNPTFSEDQIFLQGFSNELT
ncbi:hypothetical protein T439DRAFT_334204 [Meredithblackwellia eburnea MCA 4105]